VAEGLREEVVGINRINVKMKKEEKLFVRLFLLSLSHILFSGKWYGYSVWREIFLAFME